MKTVFITSFNSSISRNILDAGVLDLLAERKEIRTVLVVPAYKTDYFRRRFARSRVVVEGVPFNEVSKTSLLGYAFKKAGLFLLDTRTRQLKVGFKYYCDRKLGAFLVQRALGLASRIPFARSGIRYLDFRLSSRGPFTALVDRYRPDVIFSTDVQNENDVALMQLGRARGIRTVGMVRSWDNPTQSAFRFFPDALLVGSARVRDETVRWQGFPAERIVVVGQPHYDRYRSGSTKPRDAFFAEYGLNPGRPLILFAPFGDKLVYFNDIEQYIMELLGTVDAQVLVRMPPHRNVTLINFKQPKNMVIDRPGVVFKKTDFEDREMSSEEDERLLHALSYSDIVISGPSSILLDGIFFDKPVIAAHLCPTPRPFYETMYWFNFDHIRSLLATGGVRYATTPDELFVAIEDYLCDPHRDALGRVRARALWFSHIDGKSCERVVRELLSFF